MHTPVYRPSRRHAFDCCIAAHSRCSYLLHTSLTACIACSAVFRAFPRPYHLRVFKLSSLQPRKGECPVQPIMHSFMFTPQRLRLCVFRSLVRTAMRF